MYVESTLPVGGRQVGAHYFRGRSRIANTIANIKTNEYLSAVKASSENRNGCASAYAIMTSPRALRAGATIPTLPLRPLRFSP